MLTNGQTKNQKRGNNSRVSGRWNNLPETISQVWHNISEYSSMGTDIFLQLDKSNKENKMSRHTCHPESLNFYPIALFSAKPFGYHFCKSKKHVLSLTKEGALVFLFFILVCTTFTFAPVTQFIFYIIKMITFT